MVYMVKTKMSPSEIINADIDESLEHIFMQEKKGVMELCKTFIEHVSKLTFEQVNEFEMEELDEVHSQTIMRAKWLLLHCRRLGHARALLKDQPTET
jgi:hypothetical protein